MPTKYQGPPREVLALDTFIKLNRAVESLLGVLSRSLAAEGLTEGQFGLLEALYHLGPLGQRELGPKLLRSHANVCTVLDNLERDGLVARSRDAADRRVVRVALTELGRCLVARILPGHARQIADLMSALTEDEQRELGRLCRALGTAAAGGGGAPER